MNPDEAIRQLWRILHSAYAFDHPVTWAVIAVAGGIGFGLGELFGLLFQ